MWCDVMWCDVMWCWWLTVCWWLTASRNVAIDSLNPNDHYMYRTVVTICTATFCPHSVFMCFVWILEQTAFISLYSINWLVCITETESVYCAVRTEHYNSDNNTLQYINCHQHSIYRHPLHACSSPSPFGPSVHPSLVISAKGRGVVVLLSWRHNPVELSSLQRGTWHPKSVISST
jgi:hypothetical protein